MHQRKSKKILIYFFFLLLVGSINNIELNKINFHRIKDIKVLGLGSEKNFILLQELKKLNLDSVFFISDRDIKKVINSNSLVEKYEIFKKYPSSLHINIDKTKFLARISENGKIFYIGSNGKLSVENYHNDYQPFIFGKPNINEFLQFKKIFDTSKFLYEEVKNLYFFPSKRWDLELKNDIVVKLPKNNIKNSLDLVSKLLINKNIKDVKIIDVRIKNQIILNE
jgi:cell division protein FtsQ